MAFEVVFWHWWALGVFLLIVELLAPGIFFLWMAESAFVVGVVKLIVPALAWEYQLILFSVLSVVSIAVFRLFLKRHPIETDQPLLNQRAAQYVGRLFTLEHPIVNGQGRIRVDDSIWKVQGEDCEPGSKIRVVAADGVILKVEKAE
ncbi:NfeD family protein [Methylocaldum szegediense]|uniref:Inner membrane protein n=1 Tax=Methylocaldum szegediense TaxID=73780 RepID=A0ABN8X510_9GAMM|nr:NfeD family protein [Methylocaldum szegediense]CAI8880536.1 inner membrane protein [Methylocaldum szegediense]